MERCRLLSPADGVLVRLVAAPCGIRRLEFLPAGSPDRNQERDATALLAEGARQLVEYFAGRRRRFDLPLDLRATAFQRRVWEAVCRIPYGGTATYARIARHIGSPAAARAVGAANAANPVPLLVPCHRVVASGGGLGGYSGGVALKKRLLALEAGAGFW